MNGFKNELENNILSFWIEKMQDTRNGGFYGQIDGNDVLHPEANKGAILNARILWTFSSAYRILRKEEYLKMAQRAFDYITTYFIDKEYGGVYWELDYKGNPVNTKKQTYVQGFMLYGFSEYYRATGNAQALELAKEFFYLIENSHDNALGGYLEAYTRDWEPIEDMRLSDKDANEKKTMNTHLHVLEPYTNLCRVWDNRELKDAQKRLIGIFTDRILDKKTNHLNLFFDEEWNVKSTAISYGHDIEASWLLFEAAEVLGDKDLLFQIKSLSLDIANAASEGLEADGSMIYEKDGNHIESERHWWVQAEAVVGYMYAYKNSKSLGYKEKASRLWNYIQNRIVDHENGEWHWSRTADGSVNHKDDKAGFWKCPYHNGRMCMEMIENFKY
ncbi:N-acyl-D-glucosamine 2-epimerase [Dysgonomonas sp. 521]|uniref:AGE family epimerase/isomerase n=1 Tax=Dysgonomonas sp. 521 TaxID=2302932 RepID=UPI0013D008DF|nr:AGE family epimerase/isomerase [Dysgonomonas sp. 521]NDV94811.1 N-acyl-D-glucosamine 2-epimerase [Dysgonomonas sp. 521]